LLFNSYEFLFIFLPLTFIIYFYLSENHYRKTSRLFLVISSLFFYSWWSIIYLPLIVGSIIVNFYIGNLLLKRTNKTILSIGVGLNLSLLGYFKYLDFFIENINYLSNSNFELLNLALPLAISFFTFQQIAYLVDSYRGETYEYTLLDYSVFVTFFPQLIAGPIVHHKEMMPQFRDNSNLKINYQNISLGLFILSLGLFKKVVIADTFALWATSGFDEMQILTFWQGWATSLSYTFQLYFDFSGYTDMAIGVALLFNIKLPINFNSPYKSLDIQEFWRRWHITLSRFLRDYIYIPLGGNRKGSIATYGNIMITFILGGIWHGAGWTFVFWGFMHGVALVVNRIWRNLGFKLWSWIAWFVTFNFINISWVFFRAKEWDDATKVLGAMFSTNFIYTINHLEAIMLLLGFIITLLFKNSISYINSKFEFNFRQMGLFVALSFISILIIRLGAKSEFLYFNF